MDLRYPLPPLQSLTYLYFKYKNLDQRKRVNKRKKKTIVTTSSPYKSELEIEEKERTENIKENSALLENPKKKFVRKGNGKEEEKKLTDLIKPESRFTKESKGMPNTDVKSQSIEKFNKHPESSKGFT